MYSYAFLLLYCVALCFVDYICLSVAFLYFSVKTYRLGSMFTLEFSECLTLLFMCNFTDLISYFYADFFVKSLTVTVIDLNATFMFYGVTLLI